MRKVLKSKTYSHRAGLLLLVGVLAAVAVGGSVAAAPTTKVTWKVSSLMAGEAKKLSAVVSTNSPGVKTWLKKGTCTLTPTRKPTRVKMGASGSCLLTLKIAKSKNYPARTSKKRISLVAPATTTTTTVAPTTTIAPTTTVPITTTVAPATTVAPTTTVALTCATGGACVVGNTGPGGGTVYYVAPSNFTSTGSACGATCRYLEVAPVGWIRASTPAGQTNCDDGTVGTSSVDPRCVWSGNTSVAIGSTGTGIGTGYANTSAMILQSDTAGKAGTVARAFQGGGKTDWFLPSKDELNALCKWAFNDTVNVICNNSGSGGSSLTNGGFASWPYWSSSESSSSVSWIQDFGSVDNLRGSPGPESQSANYIHVRPVRAF
jgi:hypothetical protein